jgi:hypothetical protein
VTRNNSGSTVYVNGSSVATDSNSMGSYSYSGYQKCVIGSMPNYPGEYFPGTIDQVRVYDVALTATDVANLYNNETVSTANTLAFPTGKTAIATYKLDGDGVDISGNHSGVGDSNVKYDYSGTDTNIEYRFGRFGQAAVFNGSSSYISAGNPNSEGGARSFSAWIKTTSTAFQSIITNGGASHASGLNMFVYNNKLYSTSGKGNGENYGPTSSESINTGSWVHCVLTMSGTAIGSTLKTYVNGALDGTHTTTILITDTYDAFRIGGRYINGSYAAAWFNGQIDQVRIFNSELTSSQVTQLYNEKPETDTSNFKTVLYGGNGGTNFISNVGMDLETNGGLVWLKNRDGGNRNHRLFDSVRGATKGLYSDLPNQEFTESGLDSFEDNGFFLGSAAGVNANNESFVAWTWKGGGDAVNIGVNSITGSTPSIASDVSANVDSGFSIVNWSGSISSDAQTVGHGLSSPPELVILKNRDVSDNWYVFVNGVTSTSQNLKLNTDDGVASTSTMWGAGMTSTVVGIRPGSFVSSTSNKVIMYCFHSVAGYSSIGTYNGNGSTTGTIVTLDFAPSFVMIKGTDQTSDWIMIDNKRDTTNPNSARIDANSLGDEYTGENIMDLNSNGFQLKTSSASKNGLNKVFIYMAFK